MISADRPDDSNHGDAAHAADDDRYVMLFAESATAFADGPEAAHQSPEWVRRRVTQLQAIEELRRLVAAVESGEVSVHDSFLPSSLERGPHFLQQMVGLWAAVIACCLTVLPFIWWGQPAGFTMAAVQVAAVCLAERGFPRDSWSRSWLFGVAAGLVLSGLS